MKKRFVVYVILALIFTIAACGNKSDNEISQQNQPSAAIEDVSDSSGAVNDLQDGQESEPPSETDNTQNPSGSEALAGDDSSEQGSLVQGSNILVAYFSRVGNTVWEDGVDAITSASLNVENDEFVGNAEYLAQMVQEATGGDLFLIQTEEAYPSDYRETTNVASVEQADNARPTLTTHVENMDQYDTIVLIYPKMEYGFYCV